MKPELFSLLRCPSCGGGLTIDQKPAPVWSGNDLVAGVLYCHCCAYPVVSGIPFLRTGGPTRLVLQCLHRGEANRALTILLRLDEDREREFLNWLATPGTFTFQRGLGFLNRDGESAYLLHRFSDPTYVVSEAILRAFNHVAPAAPGRALDLGGGAGHLARCLAGLSGVTEVVLADLEFWKLWLAKEFVAPNAHAVCCDANAPLPFAPGAFPLAFCSDSLNYIWQRRLVVGELRRLAGARGSLVVTHLHNALCENPSAGLPLPPDGWRNLFEGAPVRMFKESVVLDALVSRQPVDFSADNTDAELVAEPAMFAIATPGGEGLRKEIPAAATRKAGRLTINPLYAIESEGARQVLTRHFPSAFYEEEFAAAKRYLPERVELTAEQLEKLAAGTLDGGLEDLARRRVLLELPESYL